MPISQGGSSSNLQFTSSKFPGKETEPVLTAGEVNDISMGVGQRLLDEETLIGEVLTGTLNIDYEKLATYRRAGLRVGTHILNDKDTP